MNLSRVLLLVSLAFYGCTDNSISTVHSKSVLEKEIKCMRLLVFPPDKSMEDDFYTLYNFEKDCDFTLHVSYKNSIVCNSTHKVPSMAKSYLRLELKKGKRLLYSYYVDLTEDIQAKDIENGFEKMKDTLPIKAK